MESFQILPIDEEIKRRIEATSFFGKKYARYPSVKKDTYLRTLVSKRLNQLHVERDEYFRLLGYEGFARRNFYDDVAILKILKTYEDEDAPKHIPGNRSKYADNYYQTLEHKANSVGKGIREFVAYYGYEMETEARDEIIKTVYALYGNELLNELRVNDSRGYYLPLKSTIKNNLNGFASRRKVSSKNLINDLIEYMKQNGAFVEPAPDDSPLFTIKDQTIYEGQNLKLSDLTEEEMDRMLSQRDPHAGYTYTKQYEKIRLYNISIIKNLKILYKGRCQICGYAAEKEFGSDISEAHHIEPFHNSLNNNPSNIVILCPNHHRILHKLNAAYSRARNEFVLSNGKILKIKYDKHLQRDL